MTDSLGSRFEIERERLRVSRSDFAALGEVSAEQIRRVEKDESKPGSDILSALAKAGGDVHFVLTGERRVIDAQRLAFICHAIESAIEQELKARGHANPRVLGLIYNKVLSRGRSSDDDVALAKAEVGSYLESLRAADIPEHDLAKRLLRGERSDASAAPTKAVKVTGDGNQVAGRDIHSGGSKRK